MKTILCATLIVASFAAPAAAAPRLVAKSAYYPAAGGSALLPGDSTQYTYPAAAVAAFPYYSLAEAYTYGAGAWSHASKDAYTYDAQGLMTQQAHELWNAASAAYGHFSRWSYTNNAAGLPVDQVNELWSSGTAAFVNSQHYTYTYDASGRVVSNVLQVWATYKSPVVWENNTRTTKTYNAQGLVTVQVAESWNSSTAAWVNNGRTTNTYDATGLHQTGYLYEGWDMNSNSYFNVYRRAISLDAAGRPVVAAYDIYNQTAAAWTPTNRMHYTYASSGSSDTVVLEQWNTGAARLDTTMRQDYTYNSDHQVVTMRYWSHIGGSWGIGTNAAQYNYYYEAAPAAVSNSVAKALAFRLAPNPATDVLYLHVSNPGSGTSTAALLDLQGRMLLQRSGTGESMALPVAGVPAGTYVAVVTCGTGAAETRLVTVVHE